MRAICGSREKTTCRQPSHPSTNLSPATHQYFAHFLPPQCRAHWWGMLCVCVCFTHPSMYCALQVACPVGPCLPTSRKVQQPHCSSSSFSSSNSSSSSSSHHLCMEHPRENFQTWAPDCMTSWEVAAFVSHFLLAAAITQRPAPHCLRPMPPEAAKPSALALAASIIHCSPAPIACCPAQCPMNNPQLLWVPLASSAACPCLMAALTGPAPMQCSLRCPR